MEEIVMTGSRLLKIFISMMTVVALGGLFEYKREEYAVLNRIRNTPSNKRAVEIAGENYDLISSHIKVGMSKQQVEKIIGLPQNIDNHHVWAWAFNDETGIVQKSHWMDLMDKGLMYVVFLDEQVIGNGLNVRASAAVSPVEWVMSVKNCDERTALALLGLSESEVDRYFIWNSASQDH
jgi:hypothetical protein